MLEKDPERRPRDLSEVINELVSIREKYINGVVIDTTAQQNSFLEVIDLDLNIAQHIDPRYVEKITSLCQEQLIYDCYLYKKNQTGDGTVQFVIVLAADSNNAANQELVRWANNNDPDRHETLTLDCKTSRGNNSIYVQKIQYKNVLGFRSINSLSAKIRFGNGKENGLPPALRQRILEQKDDAIDQDVARRLDHWKLLKVEI